MFSAVELIKAALYGVVEGITEWLPISSTGHLILLEEILPMEVSDEFYEMFDVVIQLGAVLAVLGLFLKTLLPRFKGCGEGGFFGCAENRKTWTLWGKIIVAVLPSAVIGLLFDDAIESRFFNARVVASMLALYGVLYIIVELYSKKKKGASGRALCDDVESVTYLQALGMGCFQVLALIPGTSRSGSTILGGLVLGFSRPIAAEFSFFMSLPTMLGASGLKALKFIMSGSGISATETAVLIVGCVVSFLVSVVAIKFLMGFVKKHTFIPFGIYRIALAILVFIAFAQPNAGAVTHM